MVEALTIVVAAGVTAGWRAALRGAFAALVVLAAVVGGLGPALVHVPLNPLRVVVGVILLSFGLQWLRKAVLRATGFTARHDENAIFAAKVAQLRQAPRPESTGFVVAFKGVFLEGVEVAVLVVTLGTADHNLGLATLSATAALVIVGAVGVVVARHLAGVPENAMKMAVGLMLISFGTFWTGEGVGVHWPGRDLAIPVLLGVYAAATWLLIRGLGRREPAVSVA
jgi:uncharacterized membrane protein